MEQHIIDILLGQKPAEYILQVLNRLMEADQYLLEIDVNERSITHRLAIYLQEIFDDWHVDCEYNRDGNDPKELYFPSDPGDVADTDARTVFPDIIIHERGTGNNYVVIEVKKSTSVVGGEWDREKLTRYRNQLGYRFALFVEFDTGHGQQGIHQLYWV